MFAYIPARIGSKRIPKKNIKELDGKPLILHVIENLMQSKSINQIGVSTDSTEISDLFKNNPVVSVLDLRKDKLANDNANFMDLINADLPRYCEFFNDKNFIFCLPTAVLVSSNDYDRAIKKFYNNPAGLVMSAVKYNISPYLALSKESKSFTPLFPEKFMEPTSNLPDTVTDCGCFYILNHEIASKVDKLIDIKPLYVHVLDSNKGIDLDNEDDWHNLEQKYYQQKSK
tara:strand:- start:68 stop:754 length:687 start_codon:yes stop_codon:yes gene_type:complete